MEMENRALSLIDTNRCHVFDVVQGTKDWHAIRKGYYDSKYGRVELGKGRITMSRLGSILIFSKTEEERIQLAKYIVGLEKQEFTEEAKRRMSIGTGYEDFIREKYSEMISSEIHTTGFCLFRENPIFGASPDGILDNGELVEFKITEKPTPTHMADDYAEIPTWYYWQMQGCMFVMNSPATHFVSYSRLDNQIYSRKVPYNHERWINEVYIPVCNYWKTYVKPLLEQHNMINPFAGYQNLLRYEERCRQERSDEVS